MINAGSATDLSNTNNNSSGSGSRSYHSTIPRRCFFVMGLLIVSVVLVVTYFQILMNDELDHPEKKKPHTYHQHATAANNFVHNPVNKSVSMKIHPIPLLRKKNHGNYVNNDGVSANEACCQCGGGLISSAGEAINTDFFGETTSSSISV